MKVALCLALLWIVATCALGEETTDNLILDGGMEEWRETSPTDGWWNYLTVSNKDTSLSRNDKGNLLTPRVFSQFLGCQTMQREDHDAHGGKCAVRMKGQFYLEASSPDAYHTQEGDVYIVRYWAKGEGQTQMHIHVYGDAITQVLEVKGKPSKDRWTLIEERIQVVGRAPTTIYPRLWASEEMLIDDVFVGRIIRDDERKLVEIPADCQERVAFASETGDALTIDGKLDEPAWNKAIRFDGFRSCKDQTMLAATPTFFRVLFDEQNLYFGFEIPLPQCQQKLRELQNDPLKNDEGKPRDKADTYTDRQSIELFLQAPGKSRYCQFVASLDGYRYDGAGMDGAWNGTWQCAVSAEDDRWFLEMRIPARDLGIESISPADGWRMNVCSNRVVEVSTWSAVGGNFHNPYAFGKLIAKDFGKWRDERTSQRTTSGSQILKESQALGRSYAVRLTAINAYPVGIAGQQSNLTDWETITRVYARMDFIDYGYRCVQEEVQYLRSFK